MNHEEMESRPNGQVYVYGASHGMSYPQQRQEAAHKCAPSLAPRSRPVGLPRVSHAPLWPWPPPREG